MWAFGITWHPLFVVCHLLTFRILTLLTVYYNGKFFLEMNPPETRIACGAAISKIQNNLSDIRSGNLEKLSDRKKNLSDRIKT
jgi:hypothetical protein